MGTIANTALKIATTVALVAVINTAIILGASVLFANINVNVDISPFLTTIQSFRGLLNAFVDPLVINLALLYPIFVMEFGLGYWLYVALVDKIFKY